jgi:putative DNA primase/helicase
MPVLFGVVTAPTLRYDGSILQQPGYDEHARIFFEPNGVTVPTIPDSPTKEQALVALGRLKALISGYQFDGAGRSVALSCMITAVVRLALPAAPGHGFDAPVAGSGKTKLFDIASVLATGHRAAAIAAPAGRNATEEMYKQLAASVLAGDQMILLDNLDIVLDLPLLCQILTEQKVRIRQFGKLKNVVAACVAMVGATGNNLAIAGDNMRRFVIARINIDVERPELRELDFEPVEEAKKHRPGLVVAALTVVRAYLISGERVKLPPLGSFERWSHRVREALVWLGEADPVDTMERVRAVDTAMLKRRQLMKAWPFVTETSVAAVIARAKERSMMAETDPATGKKITVDAGPSDPDLCAP